VLPKEKQMTQVTEAGATGAEAAKEQAGKVAGQAQEQVKEQAGQMKDRAREQVDQRSTQAGEQVSGAARDARSVAEELRKQGKDTPARYAEQVADRGERLGGYLQDSSADRILRDVEDLGRRQPWAVIAGGLALGFMASRFLKASSSERYRSATGDQQRQQQLATPTVSPEL
jgi:ElaB/YqjD/DUF883 family membrane-anchored ribosome-binding protein